MTLQKFNCCYYSKCHLVFVVSDPTVSTSYYKYLVTSTDYIMNSFKCHDNFVTLMSKSSIKPIFFHRSKLHAIESFSIYYSLHHPLVRLSLDVPKPGLHVFITPGEAGVPGAPGIPGFAGSKCL